MTLREEDDPSAYVCMVVTLAVCIRMERHLCNCISTLYNAVIRYERRHSRDNDDNDDVYPQSTRSRQNNSIGLNLHPHVLTDKSCTDDHGSCRPDITQRFLQRPPNCLGILLLRDEHTNACDIFFAALEVLDGVDDLLEDDQCLLVGRVRELYVSRFGVYRGRARDEDVWSFSDRPGVPELEFVGVRGGIDQRLRGGRVWRRESLQKCVTRV